MVPFEWRAQVVRREKNETRRHRGWKRDAVVRNTGTERGTICRAVCGGRQQAILEVKDFGGIRVRRDRGEAI